MKVALLFVLFVFGASFSSEKEDALFISIYPDYRILNENLPMKQIKHTFEEKKKMGGKASMWNLWHGCHKWSEGCRHCYVYRTDGKYGKDSSVVTKTEKFGLPLQKKKNGEYKIPSGNLVYTCFTSDFLIEDVDEWRAEAWEMMRIRQDLHFMFITKRIDRLQQCLPPDWGDGYDNVTICCTMENQDRVDYRLPIYKESPIKHKIIICEPLLSQIDFRGELEGWVEQVVAGGESGKEARVCNYDWVLDIRRQCVEAHVGFWFKQTGSYLLKDGHEYKVARQFQHSQARKAELNYTPENNERTNRNKGMQRLSDSFHIPLLSTKYG